MEFVASREHSSAYNSQAENERLERLHERLHLHTNNLGIVTNVRSRYRVDIQIVQRKKHNGRNIDVILEDVPVHVICSGGFYIGARIEVGNEVRVYYCDREIQTFLNNGGINNAATSRIHNLADAYCVPTCLSDASVESLEGQVDLLECFSDLSRELRAFALSVTPPNPNVAANVQQIITKIDGIR